MIKVITFDLDDTLWQATPVLIKAEQAVYQWLTNTQPASADHYSAESLRDSIISLKPTLRNFSGLF